jgi:hypothetical protein
MRAADAQSPRMAGPLQVTFSGRLQAEMPDWFRIYPLSITDNASCTQGDVPTAACPLVSEGQATIFIVSGLPDPEYYFEVSAQISGNAASEELDIQVIQPEDAGLGDAATDAPADSD